MATFRKPEELEADVWQATLERVEYCYDHFDKVFVSFSGGKDSTVVMHAALEVAADKGRLPVDVVFFDEEALPPETVEYVERVGARDDVCFLMQMEPEEVTRLSETAGMPVQMGAEKASFNRAWTPGRRNPDGE